MITSSPSGKTIVPSSGPLNARIVFVGESPAGDEVREGQPFVGRAGKMLNQGLRHVGIDRSTVRLMNLVPVRAPGDKFAKHSVEDLAWGRERFEREISQLKNAEVFVALGANPTEWLLGARLPTNKRGEEGFISQWRGSVIPVVPWGSSAPENYLSRLSLNPVPTKGVVVPTFHPAAVLRQFQWHPWFLMDLKRAVSPLAPLRTRNWYIQDHRALERLANGPVDLISLDTEMDPQIVGIATENEVHVFEWSELFRPALTKLLTNPRVVKIAHNWGHDHAFGRKRFGIIVQKPLYDTQGGAHILNNALQKELSPHISTRYTPWPYHKWLVNHDPLIYCGMDAVVSYDAYWPQMEELQKRGLMRVAEHDHRLLGALMSMQAKGFKIDETERLGVEEELRNVLVGQDQELQELVQPVIESKISRFEKPHLFRVERKCDCCGGGKTQREHCITCHIVQYNDPLPITLKELAQYWNTTQKDMRERLPTCKTCGGSGKVVKKLGFNSDSPDQLADVIYRGLGIRPRRFKGKETTKAANLDPIKDKHPIVAKIVEVSATRAEYDTVSRLKADTDGLLHCVYDPFGTASGRVAGKEGLVEVGTNPMNLPVKARRFVVPREGYVFLYPDMAQIEARAVAVLSKDKNLIKAFTEPVDWPGHERHGTIDSHTKVVQLFDQFGVKITRDQAKRFTYAGIYGGQASQLTVELNAEAFRRGSTERLTVPQVQLGLDTFFRVFSGVKQWQSSVVNEVLRTRRLRCPFTERERTWLGYITDEKTKGLKNEVAKQVWSFLPQNMAAWVLGLGLVSIYNSPDLAILQPLIHVHDALLIEVPVDKVDTAKTLAKQHLSRYIWGMDFPADVKVGGNWYIASGGQ